MAGMVRLGLDAGRITHCCRPLMECGWRASVAVPFHDYLEATPIDGLHCLVEVERVYGLDWGRFGEDDWQRLGRIYEGLPGALGDRGGPMWFGDDEDVPPFLRAAVEPAGLRVHGVLPEADWWAWDDRFRTGAAGLPCHVRP